MNNELYEHKRSDKVKWIVVFVAIVMLFVGVVASLIPLYGKPNSAMPTDNENTEARQESGAELTCFETTGVRLMSYAYAPEPSREDIDIFDEDDLPLDELNDVNAVSDEGDEEEPERTPEASYVIQGTVMPASVKNKTLSWNIRFVDPSSEWATGKSVSDYVTLAAHEEIENAVIVSCYAPFGEEIIITATSNIDSTKSATCRVNYVQRITDVRVLVGDVYFYPMQNGFWYLNGKKLAELRVMPDFNTNKTATVEVEIEKSDVYTKAVADPVISFSITPSDTLKSRVETNGFNANNLMSYTYTVPVSGTGSIQNYFDRQWLIRLSGGTYSAATKDKVIYMITGSVSAYEFKFFMDGEQVGGTYHSIFDTSLTDFEVTVESVSLDETELDF